MKTTVSKKNNIVVLGGGKHGKQPVAGAAVKYRTPKAKVKSKVLVTLKKKFTRMSDAKEFLRRQGVK